MQDPKDNNEFPTPEGIKSSPQETLDSMGSEL